MHIEEYRERNNLSVAQFAKLINMTPSRVYKLQRMQKPSLVNAMKIEKITKGQITVKELMQYEWK